jgi:hypothetical protein
MDPVKEKLNLLKKLANEKKANQTQNPNTNTNNNNNNGGGSSQNQIRDTSTSIENSSNLKEIVEATTKGLKKPEVVEKDETDNSLVGNEDSSVSSSLTKQEANTTGNESTISASSSMNKSNKLEKPDTTVDSTLVKYE